MTTLNIANLLNLANEAAELGPDMNEAVSGGGGRRLLPEGFAFAQLVEVIELGMHPQEFQGQKKAPAPEIQLAFALSGSAPDPANPGQVIPYTNDDGTPYIERLLPMAISRNEKAGAYLLFKALNWKGTAKNFAQLLGQKYLIKVVHKPKSKTDATIVSRLDLKTGVLPPLDPVSRQPYPIMDAPAEAFKLFLWDRPTKECWDSLYIEGMWEAKEGKPAQSKNRIQERIMSALNFQGSPLQQMLAGGAAVLPDMSAPAATAAAPAAPVAPAAPAVPTAQVNAPLAPSAPAVPQPTAPVGAAMPAMPAVPAPVVHSSPVMPV